jgi:hypothetical protein
LFFLRPARRFEAKVRSGSNLQSVPYKVKLIEVSNC